MLHVGNKLFVKFGRSDWKKENLMTIFSLKNISKHHFCSDKTKKKKDSDIISL